MSNTRSLYNCSEQHLYIATAMGWANYGDNILDFTALKGKYNVLFGTSAILDMNAAKLLPGELTRNEIPESIRLALHPVAETCLSNWRTLKSYIDEAYPGALAKPMEHAAGSLYYSAGANDSWSSIDKMNTEALTFITKYSTVLQMGTQNMPVAFVTTFTDGKKAFDTIYASYLQAQQHTNPGTNAKIIANNVVYTKLIKMLIDGQLIYSANPSKKELFTFASILSFISGTGITGFTLKLTDSITKLPITDYSVVVQPGNILGIGDKNGLKEIKTEEGLYDIEITVPNYPNYSAKGFRTITGTMSRKNIVLVKDIPKA